MSVLAGTAVAPLAIAASPAAAAGRSARRRRRHSHSSRSTRSSSSSSSSSSDDEDIQEAQWLDVQTRNLDVINTVLDLFPVEEVSKDGITKLEHLDNVQINSANNYVTFNLVGRAVPPEQCCHTVSGPEPTNPFRPEHYLVDKRDVVVSVIMFKDWIITLRTAPMQGISDVIRRLQSNFGMRVKKRGVSEAKANARKHMMLLTPSWVCAVLVDFVTERSLPDPSALLAEADAVDEMALLVSEDQAEMLQRMSELRRRIGRQSVALYRKEKLILQFLTPVMRSSFVSRNHMVAELYSHTQSQLTHISERLTAARDILSHANSNFSSNVTIQMTQASNQINGKMKVLSQVACVCLPINIVTGLWGMNCNVPFQTGTPASGSGYEVFGVIVACAALWIFFTFPLIFVRISRASKLFSGDS